MIKGLPTESLAHIQTPQQARVAIDIERNNWRSTAQLKKEGGVSPAEFEAALKNSDASSTLTPYTRQQVTAGAKDGSFTVYQLGEKSQIFFGIKKTNYADEFGFTHTDLGPNEKAVVGVINNEPGARGVVSPAVMGKAIEEGATALDAYAVPSKKFAGGFLPKLYNQYGFEELGRIPFDEKYVRDPKFGGSETKYKDLLEYWRSTGWDESLGMPKVVIMKWKGDDAIRSKARRNINKVGRLSPGRPTGNRVRKSSGYNRQSSGLADGRPQGSGRSDNSGRNRGGLRDGPIHSAQRLNNILSELKQLSPAQIENLGLTGLLTPKKTKQGQGLLQ